MHGQLLLIAAAVFLGVGAGLCIYFCSRNKVAGPALVERGGNVFVTPEGGVERVSDDRPVCEGEPAERPAEVPTVEAPAEIRTGPVWSWHVDGWCEAHGIQDCGHPAWDAMRERNREDDAQSDDDPDELPDPERRVAQLAVALAEELPEDLAADYRSRTLPTILGLLDNPGVATPSALVVYGTDPADWTEEPVDGEPVDAADLTTIHAVAVEDETPGVESPGASRYWIKAPGVVSPLGSAAALRSPDIDSATRMLPLIRRRAVGIAPRPAAPPVPPACGTVYGTARPAVLGHLVDDVPNPLDYHPPGDTAGFPAGLFADLYDRAVGS